MSVKINIHPYFSHITEGKDVLEVEGKTVGDCLEQMVQQYPELRYWLFTKDGELNDLYEVFVNMESTHPDGLSREVKDGDDIQIIIVIAGG